jgi:hypothetical protein
LTANLSRRHLSGCRFSRTLFCLSADFLKPKQDCTAILLRAHLSQPSYTKQFGLYLEEICAAFCAPLTKILRF